MHFGPEWMRPKHPLRPQNPPSPPPNPHASSGASSYSALLAPSPNNTQESLDPANPFLYSKEDLLKIYKDGGGRGGLGLEVERWEGVVRELGSEPISLKEWTDGQRKVHLTSIAHFLEYTLTHLRSFSPVPSIPKCAGVSQVTTYHRLGCSPEKGRNYLILVLEGQLP